ncbi:hypothetical protein BD779DRAFT_1495265 [Infundibulicybe gibba]|nr:hypothetical protein BD779DRAFT_1495265 [Infundibulicybe gibba]
MAKLRREPQDPSFLLPPPRPLRIVASGTLFLTHTLFVPCHPAPSTVVRAHAVEKVRGGSANTLLSLLAQFPGVEPVLVAPLGGNAEGQMILKDLENEGVITRYCKVWKGAGVPSAWVLHSAENDTRTVVNHNPLPDITHEEFVSLLGPLLAPENYPPVLPPPGPVSPVLTSPSAPRLSQSGPHPSALLSNPHSPAPFDWLHFEGRSVKTTLNNITGLDGLARERKWRSHCVFSVDLGRKGRQGVEALIPHADVLFLNKHYAEANSPNYATTPRAFLLSLTSIAPPHALLVAHWGSEGAAVLSLPTKEYFQSSGWVDERPTLMRHPTPTRETAGMGEKIEVRSVRSGSEFWADGRSRTTSSGDFTAGYTSDVGNETRDSAGMGFSSPPFSQSQIQSRRHRTRGQYHPEDDNDDDSQGTETPERSGSADADDDVLDEVGAQDAFVAGMIFALSRKIAPGSPYTPSWNPTDDATHEAERGRWRLDECLRFATELAGRKARMRGWEGLAEEMAHAGWLDN